MLRLRQCSPIIDLASASRYHHDLRCALRDRQRARLQRNRVVRCVIANRHAAFRDRDRIRCRFDAFTRQRDRRDALVRGKTGVLSLVGNCVVRFYCVACRRIRYLAPGILVVRVVRFQGDRASRDRQRTGRRGINVSKLTCHILTISIEDLELGYRIHCLLAFARRYVRYSSVCLRCPGKAIRHACYGKVVMIRLCQCCPIIDLLPAAGFHGDLAIILRNRQRSFYIRNAVVQCDIFHC